MKENKRIALIALSTLIVGIVIGGLLFSDTRPRSFLAIRNCQRCFSPSEFAGLFASVLMQKMPGALPDIVMETDKTVVIKHPFSSMRYHYVLIPKRDIRDFGDMSAEDKEYFLDVMACAQKLIHDEKLSKYRFYTNGPGYQSVGYLHFHLVQK